MVKRRYEEAFTDKMKEELAEYLVETPCPSCHGARLRPESLAFRVGGKNIAEISDMPVTKLLDFSAAWNCRRKNRRLPTRSFGK